MITQETIEELSTYMKWFSISYGQDSTIIEWKLMIDALFDFKKKEYILFPNDKKWLSYLFKELDIRIEIKDDSAFRNVREMSDNIPKTMEYHINPWNKSICLFLPEEIALLKQWQSDILSPNKYISNFIIPYFFDALYYIKSWKWPRWEYAHWELGYLQFLEENRWKNDKKNNLLIILSIEKLLESQDWAYYYDYLYQDKVRPYLIKKINESINNEKIKKALEWLKRILTRKNQPLILPKFTWFYR